MKYGHRFVEAVHDAILGLFAGAVVALGLLASWVAVEEGLPRWAASRIQQARGPLRVTIINKTPATLATLELGGPGGSCTIAPLEPGWGAFCEPPPSPYPGRLWLDRSTATRRGPSGYCGGTSREDLVRRVDWSTYGELRVFVTDGGVVLENRLRDAL